MSAKLIIGNYNYSSWSLRAWLAATWSGLQFDVVRLPLDTDRFRSEIAALSPSGRVPVLYHEDIVVWDSLAIAEYLAERYPAAQLWPADRTMRARARAASAEMHAGFETLRREMPMNCRATGRRVAIGDALQADISRIEQLWSACLAASGGPFLFGSCTIADAMYAPVVFRFESYGVTHQDVLGEYRSQVLGMAATKHWLAKATEEKEVIEAEEVGR